MPLGDYDYFKGRAREEDKAARLAACIEARICHEKLAEAYRRRCMEMFSPDSGEHGLANARADQPETRQPMVASNMAVLTPRDLTAARPFCRA